MSKIGRKPVPVPVGIKVTLEGNGITVAGPLGKLDQALHPDVSVTLEDRQVLVSRPTDQPKHKALHGLTRALINNMVIGVSQGFNKTLELVGVGYRVQKAGEKVSLNVGFSHLVEIQPLPGVTLTAEGDNRIVVKGVNKQVVGEMAAQIRKVRPPNPYTGKGIRYAGEYVRRKAGKTAAKKA